MKKLTLLLCILLSTAACNTTQSTAQMQDAKPEKVQDTEKKKEEVHVNPFAGKDIPRNQNVSTSKPLMCGRLDVFLTNVEKQYGEKPIFMGDAPAIVNGSMAMVKAILTYNVETTTFTFFEQMPSESRLICVLSSGKGKVTSSTVFKEKKTGA